MPGLQEILEKLIDAPVWTFNEALLFLIGKNSKEIEEAHDKAELPIELSDPNFKTVKRWTKRKTLKQPDIIEQEIAENWEKMDQKEKELIKKMGAPRPRIYKVDDPNRYERVRRKAYFEDQPIGLANELIEGGWAKEPKQSELRYCKAKKEEQLKIYRQIQNQHRLKELLERAVLDRQIESPSDVDSLPPEKWRLNKKSVLWWVKSNRYKIDPLRHFPKGPKDVLEKMLQTQAEKKKSGGRPPFPREKLKKVTTELIKEGLTPKEIIHDLRFVNEAMSIKKGIEAQGKSENLPLEIDDKEYKNITGFKKSSAIKYVRALRREIK